MRPILASLVLVLLLIQPGFAAEPPTRIAVMSAFPAEMEKLLAATEGQEHTVINGNRFTTGTLEGKPVVLALSGISIVNAAMTTQLLLERFPVRAIVFSGIAGGIDPSLHIGDVTVPARWGNYLEGTFARELPDGGFAPPPFRPKVFPNFGMIHPQEVPVRTAGPDGGLEDIETRFWFEVDAALLETARRALDGFDLEACTAPQSCLEHEPKIVIGGNGLTGPVFMDNAAFRTYAYETFDADALDMESGAVAHVAYANGVPFIAFRSLSDLAGGDHGENQIRTFGRIAADNSAAVVKAFLRTLD